MNVMFSVFVFIIMFTIVIPIQIGFGGGKYPGRSG